MTEYYVVFALADGDVRYRGSGPDGATDLQRDACEEGLGVLGVPREAMVAAEIDLDPIRESLTARIDAEAEEQRQRFISAHRLQHGTYRRKEEQARALAVDPLAAVPLLAVEAAATGRSVAEVAANVIAAADAWHAADDAIEALRMGAKAAIRGAAHLGELHAAQLLNWRAELIAAGIEGGD